MEERKNLTCPVCGGDGHNGWTRCRKHGEMICMTCCRACQYHLRFSGLWNCTYQTYTSTLEDEIRHLENQSRSIDMQIRWALRRGEEEKAEKAREEKHSIERNLIRKKRTLEGYSRAKGNN